MQHKVISTVIPKVLDISNIAEHKIPTVHLLSKVNRYALNYKELFESRMKKALHLIQGSLKLDSINLIYRTIDFLGNHDVRSIVAGDSMAYFNWNHKIPKFDNDTLLPQHPLIIETSANEPFFIYCPIAFDKKPKGPHIYFDIALLAKRTAESFNNEELYLLHQIMANFAAAFKSTRKIDKSGGIKDALKLAISKVNTGIVIADASGQIRNWNDIMENITGIKEKKLLGKRTYIFDLPEEKIKPVLNVTDAGRCHYSNETLTREGLLYKDRIYKVNYAPTIHKNKKTGMVITVADDTEAFTDGLTGLYNFKFLAYYRDYYLRKLQKQNKSFSVMMLDLDFFKEVNDTYGHDCGNFALLEITNIMKLIIGKNGTIFRYGGEEFLIVIPDSINMAQVWAEAIREKISNHEFIYIQSDQDRSGKQIGEPIKFKKTISIGIAGGNKAEDPLRTIQRADDAMYKAKEQGRNRTVTDTRG